MAISPLENSQAVRDYLNRHGAKIRSLFTAAIVVESLGYQKDEYTFRFDRSGNVRTATHLMPTAEEATAIKAEVSALVFPEQQLLSALPNSDLPPLIRDAEDKNLFIFRNKRKQIVFIQVRLDLENGDKRYVPQTYWSDGVWRMAEPEAALPIYGIEDVEKGDRVFLHEGAKAAKAAKEIAASHDHPWSSYFSTGKHVGWIGGAHYLHKTSWSELIPLPGELIIVPDNDFIGRSRVNKIAGKFACPVSFVMMDNKWPQGWDVADPLPKRFYSEVTLPDGAAHTMYSGPEFEQMMHPCDWATREYYPDDSDKPVYAIREEFAQNWVRIQLTQQYAHLKQPETALNKDQFNVAVRPYSDVPDTANLLHKFNGNIVDKVTFMPSEPGGIINLDGELCLNQYVDRRIRPAPGGDTGPFWDFMNYLFPIDTERKVVAKWMATLYAKPHVRMGYALLLLSKLQGVGKSTLLNLLAEMIGKRHVSFPGDAMIQGDFNGWIVNKRLVVVHEIYAGQNWKTYNRLKTLITDEHIEANNKHVANYTLPNWTHYGAASNSLEALRMEHDDRRWFVPKLPELLYDNYGGLYEWIGRGGLRNLAAEFLDFPQYVRTGDTAPQTEAKAKLIDQSMPMDERFVCALVERMEPTDCMDIKDIWIWLQDQAKGRAYTTPQRISSLLTDHGYKVDEPERIGSRIRQLVWGTVSARAKLAEGKSDDDLKKAIMARMREPGQVFKDETAM